MICRTCGAALAVSDAFCPTCQAPAPPPMVRLGARTYPVTGIGTAAVVAAWVTAGFTVAYWLSTLIGRSLAVQARDTSDPALLDVALLVTVLVSLPLVVALLTTAVLTIIWTYRARKNLDAFPDAATPISVGWSIAGWLVPFVNLVMPYRVVANIARETLRRADTPTVLKVWWAAWIGWAIVDRLVSRADEQTYGSLPQLLSARSDYQRYVGYYGEAFGYQAIVAAVMVLAAYTFTRVIRQISAAQRDRIAGSTPAFHPVPGMAVPATLAGPAHPTTPGRPAQPSMPGSGADAAG
ncbi:DUF4328 domain-containing protein [Solwaraspora sp. WMMD1047]|uniref:DUF4328 domain-containing protein n=1 Tax=Solwaraspora sp. WMMD1047 TaxID=3016102 RepID=UPI0024176DBA|nr:DUF4328 domain-containing protein [Solwaraspora sp. WMMD1047]MDG4830271.1 DUF4328 domain-containing protein [Solwaraspora sp. WMMD1047]